MSGSMAWPHRERRRTPEIRFVSSFTAFLPPWCERPAWAQALSSASTSGERTIVPSRTKASWLSSMLSWS